MKQFLKYINKVSFLLAFGWFAGACDRPEYPEPNITASDARSSIQVINTSPGSTPINLSVDNTPLAGDIPYLGTYNNGYLPIPGGQRLLEITNFDANNVSKTIALRQPFNTGSNNTIFLTDAPTRTGTGSDPGGVRYLVLPDNLTAPAAGKAGLRFINIAPGATSVSYGLYNTLTQQSILPTSKQFTSKAGTTGTINNLQNRSFREVSKTLNITNPDNTRETFTEPLTGFTTVDPGTFSLDARTSQASAPAATLLNVTLEAGKLYTIFLHGVSGNATTPLGLSIIRHN